jgi:hypothetical protein
MLTSIPSSPLGGFVTFYSNYSNLHPSQFNKQRINNESHAKFIHL